MTGKKYYIRRLMCSVALPLCMLVSACNEGEEISFDNRMIRAEQQQNAGNYNAAIIELKNTINQYPKNLQARKKLGKLYLFIGNGASAEKELSKLKTEKNNEELNLLLAEARLYQGHNELVIKNIKFTKDDLDEVIVKKMILLGKANLALSKLEIAEEYFQKTLLKSENNLQGLIGVIEIAFLQEKEEKVKEFLIRAEEFYPNNREILTLKGHIFWSQNKFEDAENIFKKLTVEHAYFITNQINLAWLQVIRGRFDEANLGLITLRRILPQHPTVNYVSALYYYKMKDFKLAREYAENVINKLPNHMQGTLVAGISAYETEDNELAYKYISIFNHQFPENELAIQVLADLQVKLGQSDKAVKGLKSILGKTKNKAYILDILAEIEIGRGELSLAKTYLERSLKQDNKQGGRALMRLGRLVASMGDLDEGLEYLKKAVDQAENPYLNKLELARIMILAGKTSKSLKICTELQTENPEDMNGFMCEAVAYNKDGKIKKAQDLYNKVLQKDPKNLVASRLLYGTYFDAGEYSQAEGVLRKYLLNIENDEFALLGLFYIEQKRNNSEKAIRYLEKSFEKNNERIATAIELSRYYLNTRNIKNALKISSVALNGSINNMALLEVKGLAELSLDRFTFAENTFNRLLKIDEENETVIGYLARAYEGNKNFKALEILAQKMVEKNPSSVMGRIYHIEVLVNKIRWDEAEKLIDGMDISKFDKKTYDHSLIWALKGRIKLETGKLDVAERAFEMAFSTSPKTERILQLSHSYRLNNHKNKSFEKLREWLSEHPKDVIVQSYLADFYLDENKYNEAIKLYMALNNTHPHNPSILNNLAWGYFKLEKMKTAASYIRQARKIDGSSLTLMDTEAEILYGLKAYDKVVRLYTKMIDVNNQNYFVKYKLSRVLVQQDKQKEALKILEVLSRVTADYKMKTEALKLYRELKMKEVL